jgi:hypothetical protein
MGLSLHQRMVICMIFSVCVALCRYRPWDGPIPHPKSPTNCLRCRIQNREMGGFWIPLTRKYPLYYKKVLPNSHTIKGYRSTSPCSLDFGNGQLYVNPLGKDPHSNYCSVIFCYIFNCIFIGQHNFLYTGTSYMLTV